MLTRVRGEQGFGVIELVVAMVILNVGLLTLLVAFSSGAVALRRASHVSTGATLADTQMELYRSLTYSAIALDSTSVNSTDSVYRADSALGGSISNDITTTSGCSGLPNQCNPSRAVTGPDHGAYRIDTYIVSSTPSSGRALKLVTVVVRDSLNLSGTPLARQVSSFDQATGT